MHAHEEWISLQAVRSKLNAFQRKVLGYLTKCLWIIEVFEHCVAQQYVKCSTMIDHLISTTFKNGVQDQIVQLIIHHCSNYLLYLQLYF